MGCKISSMNKAASSSDDDTEGVTGAKFLASSSAYTEDVMADRSSPKNDAASSSDDDNEGVIGAEFLAAVSENRGEDAVRILQEADNYDLIFIADSTEDSALHIAAKIGHFDTVRLLIDFLQLEKKQNNNWRLLKMAVTQKNSHGDTALHLAIRNNHLDLARLLFLAWPEAGWHRNNDGDFVWDEAKAFVTEEELERAFMEIQDDPDRVISGRRWLSSLSDIEMDIIRNNMLSDEWRIKYLIRAAKSGQVYTVMLTLSVNPDLTRLGQSEEDTGLTILHVAAACGRVKLLKKLLQFMIKHEQSSLMIKKDKEYGDTALHRAIRGGHKEAAIYLFGVAPEAAFQVNRERATALHLALKKDLGDLIILALQFMPGISILKSLKESMVEGAESFIHAVVGARNLAYNGYLEEVRYILENFPHALKKFDANGSLPIHKAVAGGHISIVSEFLSHSPQAIREVDRKGRTILHFAVMYTKAHILSYLTKEIKQINEIFGVKDHEGKTFADLAKELSSK